MSTPTENLDLTATISRTTMTARGHYKYEYWLVRLYRKGKPAGTKTFRRTEPGLLQAYAYIEERGADLLGYDPLGRFTRALDEPIKVRVAPNLQTVLQRLLEAGQTLSALKLASAMSRAQIPMEIPNAV